MNQEWNKTEEKVWETRDRAEDCVGLAVSRALWHFINAEICSQEFRSAYQHIQNNTRRAAVYGKEVVW